MDRKTAIYLVLQELERRTEKQALDKLYPDSGGLRRDLYTKHMQVFAAGAEHNERCCLGGNRVGKTLSIGGYETAIHLTGLYPKWWVGKRFSKPILAWACGTKSTKVRAVNQQFLLGNLTQIKGYTQASGGLIPAAKVGRLTRKSGVADAVDEAIIQHVNGYENRVTFKSYEEGRTSFEAEEVDFIWLDEECQKSIYDECKMRIITSRGSILSTYTPIEGMTETTISILRGTNLL